MIWSDTTSILVGVAKMFLIFIGMVLLMVIILISVTSVRCRINPFKLARKGLPTLIIALTTASSAAAFGNNMTACRKEYGIDDTIASFGIPLGMVTFKPTTALNYISVALFFSESYHVEVSASWVIVMVLTATILAIADFVAFITNESYPMTSMQSFTVHNHWLEVASFAVDDGGNHLVDAGENDTLRVWFKNAGTAPIHDLQFELRFNEADITMLDTRDDLYLLNPAETKMVEFAFHTEPDFDCHGVLDALIDVTSTGQYSETKVITSLS